MRKAIVGFLVLVALLAFSMNVVAKENTKATKNYSEGYALNIKYCTSCHDSVANPELTGYTRDGWYTIINVMHNYGMQTLPQADADELVDYFYTIRKGMEKDAG